VELLRKRSTFALLACLGLVAVLAGSSCRPRLSLPGDTDEDMGWVMAGGDAGHGGFSPERLALPLKLCWKARTRGPIVASPIATGELICVGTLGRRFYFFSAADGRQYDTIKTDSGVAATAALGEGSVYLATEVGEGEVYALDLRRGDIRWKKAVGDISAALTYVRDRILVSTNQGQVCCLAAEDGSQIWQFSTRGLRSSAVAVSGEMAVCGCDDGEERWNRQVEGAVWSMPIADDGDLYVGTFAGYLYCLSADGGEIIWRRDLEGSITRPPAVGPEMVFAGTDRGLVLALERRNGQTRWTRDLSGARPGAPLATADVLFVGDSDGRLRGLSIDTGKLMWSYRTDRAIVSAPAIWRGRLYLGSMDGNLYAFGPEISGAASARPLPLGP
jgi:outer membrane protein assembly factor BamB